MSTSTFAPVKGLVFAVMLLMSTLYVTFLIPPTEAVSSINVINNPSFEDGEGQPGVPTGWFNSSSTVTASTSVDGTRAAIGRYSAKITLGQVALGFAAIFQNLPPNTKFSNLTNSIDNIELVFYLEPSARLGDFAIKIYAENAQELDYVFDPGGPLVNYPNQTDISGTRRPTVKSILLGDLTGTNPQFPAGRWHLFNFRNLRADWQAPMRYFNTTCSPCILPGFGLNETFSRIEIDAIAFQDPSTDFYYSTTVWTDEVKLFLDSNLPPPPPPPLHSLVFNFTDQESNPIDNVVRWRLFNQTDVELTNYKLGDVTLRDETYTIQVYYPAITMQPVEPYLLMRGVVPLDTSTVIKLAMVRENTGPNDYIAFNSPVNSTALTFQDSTKISFTAVGPPLTYKVHVKVSGKPTGIFRDNPQVELSEGGDWTFDSTYSIATITTANLGDFSIYFVLRPRIPTISFQDRAGLDTTSLVNFEIFNSLGDRIPYLPGQVPPDENFPYKLKVVYEGNVIYRNPFDLSLAGPITLQMLRISDAPGYIAVNSTVTSITVTENSASRLVFAIDASGPATIIVKVPKRPSHIERNGARIASWVYDSNRGTAVVETNSLGTFTIFFETTSPLDFVYGGTAAAVVAAIVTVLVVRKRRARKTSNPQEKPTDDLKGKKSIWESGDKALHQPPKPNWMIWS